MVEGWARQDDAPFAGGQAEGRTTEAGGPLPVAAARAAHAPPLLLLRS